MHRIICGLIAALACSAAAPIAPTRTALHFTGYVLGLPVMNFAIDLAQSGETYDVQMNYHTTGPIRVFFPADREVTAHGTSTATRVQPLEYEINGQARGRIYHAIIHFGAVTPVVDNESPREPANPRDQFQPIPPALTANAIDNVSAVLGLLRQVAATGRCERDAHVFDGRMLTDLRATTAPDQLLTADHGSVFAGVAHQCRFTGQVLAGGPKPPPGRDRRRGPPPVGTAWIAPIGPAGEMLLVRVAFTTPTGSLVFYLDQNQTK